MIKPKVFIGSSCESLKIVEAVNIKLSSSCEITQWDNVFDPSSFTFATLAKKSKEVDFAVFVFNADDEIIIRNKDYSIVRDNVLFELGLFIGSLGIERCFFICPDTVKQSALRIPTDLSGITFCTFEQDRIAKSSLDAVSAACARIRMTIDGYLQSIQENNSDQSQSFSKESQIKELEREVYRLSYELKESENERIKIESSLIEYFNFTSRPATPNEVRAWIEGAKHNDETARISNHDIFFTDKDIIIPPLHGARSIGLIVAKGANVFGLHNRGHNEIYYMDGFRKV